MEHRFYIFVLFFVLAFAGLVDAQDGLPERQQQLSQRYAQLEQVLLRMSEASATTDPRRAALLKKVLLESKDKLLSLRMENLVQFLRQQRLTDAVTGQEGVEKDLQELLRLLESENREQRRLAEKEKIMEFLRDLEEIIHQEKTLKTRTAQREDENLLPLEKEQRDLRLKSQALRDRIARSEDSETARPESSPADSEAAEKAKDDKKEGTPPADGSDPKSPEKDKQDSKNDSDADPSEPTEDPNASPTRQAMQKALSRMRQAEKKLREAQKDGALEEQEEAIAELQRVKAELEKILRQIREEELMQTLEKLEARFKRMLRVEQSVRTQTEKLGADAQKAEEAELRQIRIQAGRIAADQQSVLDDADAALVLLREDGTAQAMVESLLQTRFDMTEIGTRLEQTRLDSVTLGIEDTVIASLEEMLEAIDTAIKEAQNRRESAEQQSSPPEGEGGDQEEPLIQLLSELKMIRSMQRRVNDRTDRYEKEIEQAANEPDPDYGVLRKKVEELARQQNRISRILHDLKVGRTQ